MSEDIEFLQKESIKERTIINPNLNNQTNKISINTSSKNNKETILHKSKSSFNTNYQFSFKDFAIFLLSFLSIIIYILSLKGCNNTQTYCLVNLDPSYFYLFILSISFSSIIVAFLIFFVISHKVHYIHLIYTLSFYFYLLLIYDTGNNLSNHGSYNKSLFIIFLIFYSLCILFIKVVINLRRNNYNKTIIIIGITTLLLIPIFFYKLRSGCNKWEYGLFNQRIIDDPQLNKCTFVRPSKCWVNLLDGLLDVSWIIQEDCNNFRNGERNELLKYLPSRFKETFNFAYPSTINYTWLNQSHYNNFFSTVLSDFIDLDKDNYYSKIPKPEILLKFNPITQLGKITMQIQRNEFLIKEREEVYKGIDINERPRYKNILFVYIDALSRVHFLRKMKKTAEFLTNYRAKSKTKGTVYQMMKYHSFKYNTPPNVNPMFYGESMHNNNGTHIIRAFKSKGYITAQSNNFCSRELYDIEHDYTKGMDFESFDHENIAMFCDPNFHNKENPFTPYLGPYSVRRRCLYGRDTFDYVLDYGEKWWEVYKDQRKFLRVAFQDAHEGTGEVVRYLDDRLRDFMELFMRKGFLKETAVFFVSDHGNTMIGVYEGFQVQDFVMEKTLASWYMILPDDDINNENVRKNEQVIVTPYDIHDTMVDMLGYEKKSTYYSRYGQTIFERIDGRKRSCSNYTLDLAEIWCRCYE